MPRRRTIPSLPFGVIASGITSSLRTAFSPYNLPRRNATCMIRPPGPSGRICTDTDCNWFSTILQSLIPPAAARSTNPKDRSPLDAVMSDLSDFERKQLTKSRRNLSRYPVADRIVAIGDIHGDLDAFRTALRNSGLINDTDVWIGGKSVLVQVGDQLDRGNREREIYELLFRLQDSAPAHGGAVHILLGNHEIMNVRLDFRYVTPGGFEDFSRDGGVKKVFSVRQKPQIPAAVMKQIRTLPSSMRARAKSLCSGGPLAMELAERSKISVIVGDNIFVHGGISPRHLTFGGRDPMNAIDTLEELNRDAKEFLLGKINIPIMLRGSKSPIWLRDYSRAILGSGSETCRMLADTLKLVKAKRMIVGHTPQATGINSACGGKVWRIDTGMSSAYGGVPEAIEITKRGGIRIFTTEGVVQGSARYK